MLFLKGCTMEYSTLNELISHLEYGTRLHIGVLFLGNYAFEALRPTPAHTIHASPVCAEMKTHRNGFERCYLCRNKAIAKACQTGRAFGGLCINGVYEYVHPILEGTEVVCVLFIGNILPEDHAKIQHRLGTKSALLDMMEADFSPARCAGIAALLESYIRLMHLHAPSKQDGKEPLLENMKSYIEANLEYDMTLSALSRIFHYNEKYLGRLFKRKCGMSFRAYVNERRLESAKRRLLCGQPISTVAACTGFGSAGYFNRVFKARMGCTPSEFCAKHKNG